MLIFVLTVLVRNVLVLLGRNGNIFRMNSFFNFFVFALSGTHANIRVSAPTALHLVVKEYWISDHRRILKRVVEFTEGCVVNTFVIIYGRFHYYKFVVKLI